MRHLPTGTVTFLFTDIEGSTALWERQPEAMRIALMRHDALVREAVEGRGGFIFKKMGDGFCAVFDLAPEAVAAAVAAQRLLSAETWEEAGPLRVRMALHSGTVREHGGDYSGQAVQRASGVLSAGHGGQILLSLATAELVRGALPEGTSLRDLGEHRLKDLILSERIFQLLAAGLPAAFPPLRTLDSHPNNLPLQPTPLIGRERELEALRAYLLRGDVRLVTLTGAAGTGKTRLALQCAANLLDSFADGIYFVALAPLSDPGLVTPTLAQTLGLQEAGAQPVIDRIVGSLHSKAVLLVLDNFEHLLAAGPLVTDLLASCPRLKVLVTSRAVLRLRSEHVFPVPPLQVPDPARLPRVEDLTQSSAVVLFVQRARAVRSDFALTLENAPTVAGICVRLDGLPLAIELAAARSLMLSPAAILGRLESRLQLLTGGARDLPARHQTLRGAIAWSYELLEAGERAVFRRLAVFVGGFTLEMAETVCRVPADLEVSILEAVASLVDKSLLKHATSQTADGEPRYEMLDTIREYALESLRASDEADAVRREHAKLFLRLAEEAEPGLASADRVAWLKRLELEHSNLRAALEWSRDADDGGETALRLAGALSWFWHPRGYLSEGRGWLQEALALSTPSERTQARAKALYGAGAIAIRQGDYPLARSWLEESLAIWRELGNERGIALALLRFGETALMVRDYAAARSWLEESLGIFRKLGDRWGLAMPLSYLGEVMRCQGDYQRAGVLYEECLAHYRELNDNLGIALMLHNLGYVAQHEDEHRRAVGLFQESLAFARAVGYRRGVALCLFGLAGSVVRERQPQLAATVFGAAEAFLAATGTIMNPADAAEYERNLAALRAALDEESLARARAQGRTMAPEEAVATAQAALAAAPPAN